MARSRISVSLFTFFLFVSLQSFTHAAVEEIWQYTVSTLPGQTFDTLEKAEAAMRGLSTATQYLIIKQDSVYTGDGPLSINYYVPLEEHTVGPWFAYIRSPITGCLASEGAVVQALLDHAWEYFSNDPVSPLCDVSFEPLSGWEKNQTFSLSGTICGVNASYLEAEQKFYKLIYVYTANIGPVCGTTSDNDGGTYHRIREKICPDGYSYSVYSRKCENPETATITGTLLQYCTKTEGNPCSPATGEKSQTETDFNGPGLSFTRSYHSHGQITNHSSLGNKWQHNYSAFLVFSEGQPRGAVRQTGKEKRGR